MPPLGRMGQSTNLRLRQFIDNLAFADEVYAIGPAPANFTTWTLALIVPITSRYRTPGK